MQMNEVVALQIKRLEDGFLVECKLDKDAYPNHHIAWGTKELITKLRDIITGEES